MSLAIFLSENFNMEEPHFQKKIQNALHLYDAGSTQLVSNLQDGEGDSVDSGIGTRDKS